MILITPPQAPKELRERAERAFAHLARTADAGGYKKQRRFDFDRRIWLSARESLAQASHGKCAYCESKIGPTAHADVDHFRPKLRAEGLHKGEVAPDHYWWLAYTWENFVHSCQSCNRAKRNRFPVDGRRIDPFEPLEDEKPLLLSPYGPERPADHLWFDDDGTVAPVDDMGAVTIEVLALNRLDLVKARAARARGLLQRLEENSVLDDAEWEELTAPHQEYAALVRQIVERRATRAGADAPEVQVTARSAPPAKIDETPADLGAVWIEGIDLVNFGCVQELELRFSEPAASREPWIVLLGANGVGKSTILKAIALTLSSAEERHRLAPDASRLLNRNTRAKEGHVRLAFNTGQELRLELRRGSSDFIVDGRRPDFSLVGYGSTRLLRRDHAEAASEATGPRLTNLFDPWAPLADAEPWLADPKRVGADDFKVLASSLKTLLSVGADVELRRRSGRLQARLFDELLDLRELSDGYQSVLAFALDLSLAFGSEMGQGFSTDNYSGMVLLDEIEVHLHPAWRLRVVSDLRAMFPHLQFVVTTHDPLCLRGLENGEIHLLQRDEEDRITIEQIDVPPGLDADEILTGQWFGLDTTLDQQVEADLLEYRRLRMEGLGADAPEIAELRGRLEGSLGSYAGTSLGEVMVEAASAYVEERTATETPQKLSKEEIKERLLAHARKVRS